MYSPDRSWEANKFAPTWLRMLAIRILLADFFKQLGQALGRGRLGGPQVLGEQ